MFITQKFFGNLPEFEAGDVLAGTIASEVEFDMLYGDAGGACGLRFILEADRDGRGLLGQGKESQGNEYLSNDNSLLPSVIHAGVLLRLHGLLCECKITVKMKRTIGRAAFQQGLSGV